MMYEQEDKDEKRSRILHSRECGGMELHNAGAKVALDFWLWIIAIDHHDVFSRHALTFIILAVASRRCPVQYR